MKYEFIVDLVKIGCYVDWIKLVLGRVIDCQGGYDDIMIDLLWFCCVWCGCVVYVVFGLCWFGVRGVKDLFFGGVF